MSRTPKGDAKGYLSHCAEPGGVATAYLTHRYLPDPDRLAADGRGRRWCSEAADEATRDQSRMEVDYRPA